ncbi:MAG TPA: hypothetical protein VF651_06565 [Gammaproteobacteria bacterium]
MSFLYLVTGLMACVYGGLLLWSAKNAGQEPGAEHWLNSEEVKNSRFNNFENMRYIMKPERKNISFSRSKGRAYAMLAIGLALIVMAFT